MTGDVPSFTDHEARALVYIREAEIERDEEAPANISELVDMTGWRSKYYTRAWKRLQPRGLINRVSDGQSTRLELTDKGSKVADKLMEINEALENAD